MYSIPEGNFEEENNGYVVFKKNIYGSTRKKGGERGCSLLPPSRHHFLQQASGKIYKDDVTIFLPPRIFASLL
jgi:hypothetical protein